MECRPCHERGRYIPSFWGFTDFTASIPKLYFDVESVEQRYHRICELLNRLICYAGFLGDKGNEFAKELETLKSEFEEFKESGFEDYYLEQIEKWVNDNLETLYHLLVKQVYFGLTLDDGTNKGGRLVAYIPESWDDIVFDTGYDYSLDTYGRLILRWSVDGSSVDQRPETNQFGVIGG